MLNPDQTLCLQPDGETPAGKPAIFRPAKAARPGQENLSGAVGNLGAENLGKVEMLKIWGRTNSSDVQKVLSCCTELGLEFERVDWGGKFGGNDDPAYRAMNPNGLVPTVKDGDLIIWEANTVMRYLCATRNGAKLYPADPGKRSHVERWMDWNLSRLTPPMAALLWGYYRTPPEQRDAAALGKSRETAIMLLTMLDNQVAKQDYLAGSEFTLADIGPGIWAHRWNSLPIDRPKLPHFDSWFGRVSKRPGFVAHIDGPVS
jgi:glutathione S-transferase